MIERITQEHLIGKLRWWKNYVFLTHPLPETSLVACEQLIEDLTSEGYRN
ncbi:hypothetical protein [Tolypothrix tenuis]